MVIPFNLWQTFEPKISFTLLDKEFGEKKIGYRFAMGKLTHPSGKHGLWSPRDIELEYNSKYQALQSQFCCINIKSHTGKK